jgi:hypothetical protein
LGLAVFGTYSSDELFHLLGFDRSDAHNALSDALFSLKTFQIVRKLMEEKI